MFEGYSFWELLGAAVFAAAAVKSFLFWTYLLQLKEYRLDRFRAEYGKPGRIIRFWFFAGGRRLSAPAPTARAGAVLGLALAAYVLAVRADLDALLVSMLAYVAAPVAVAVAVIITQAPVAFAKRILLARAGRKIAKLPDLIVIGITGSFGKSSTKEFLAAILRARFKVTMTPRNVNSELGIARFILSPAFDPKSDVFVAEIGAYREGEIRRVAREIKPKIGVITGISDQHAALFGSLERTMRAKYELIETLPENGVAFFNGDNIYARAMGEWYKGRKIFYSVLSASRLAPLPEFYRVNVSAAIAVARELGLTDGEIEKGVRMLEPAPHMMRSFTHVSGALIIKDVYSANPDGVIAALGHLDRVAGSRKRAVIMPCLIELGARARELHEMIGKKIAEARAEAIITTPEFFDAIRAGAGGRAKLITDPNHIIAFLKDALSPEHAILLEGRISESVVQFLGVQ